MKTLARLLFLIFSSFAFWGCNKDHSHIVVINDQAKLFEPQTPVVANTKGIRKNDKAKQPTRPAMSRAEVDKKLQEIVESKAVDIVVHTTSSPSLSAIDLPNYLDESFENESAWANVSDKNWFAATLRFLHFRPKAPPDSVEFIVVAEPKIRCDAFWQFRAYPRHLQRLDE